jgi:hypothetical protein
MSCTVVALGEVAEINPDTLIRAKREDVVSFVPMNTHLRF